MRSLLAFWSTDNSDDGSDELVNKLVDKFVGSGKECEMYSRQAQWICHERVRNGRSEEMLPPNARGVCERDAKQREGTVRVL